MIIILSNFESDSHRDGTLHSASFELRISTYKRFSLFSPHKISQYMI